MYYNAECSVDEFLSKKSEEIGRHISPFSSILRRAILFPGMIQVHRQVMMSSIAKQFIPVSDPGTQLLVPEYTEDLPDIPGLYLRTAFMLWEGWNLEDAVVISKSAARRMSTNVVRREAVSTPTEPESLVSVGDPVRRGTPLGYWNLEEDQIDCGYPRRREVNLLTMSGPIPGVVTSMRKYTEVRNGATIWNLEVGISSEYYLTVGSKISNLHASKSIISRIVPDSDMPHDLRGEPVDLLISPYAIARRMAPSTILEIMLNTYIMELGRRTGKELRMVIDPFDPNINMPAISQTLASMGLDPECHTQLRDGAGRCYDSRTLVGPMWVGRLHHHSQDKLSTSNDQPVNHRNAAVRGVGSQRLGREEVEVLLQYGATGMIEELKELQGRVGTKDRISDLLDCLGGKDEEV